METKIHEDQPLTFDDDGRLRVGMFIGIVSIIFAWVSEVDDDDDDDDADDDWLVVWNIFYFPIYWE